METWKDATKGMEFKLFGTLTTTIQLAEQIVSCLLECFKIFIVVNNHSITCYLFSRYNALSKVYLVLFVGMIFSFAKPV